MTKKHDELQMDQNRLVEAWQRTLPTTMNEADSTDVQADEANPRALRIHIRTAGHTAYTFDFKVEYVDSREVKVDFIDVEKAGISVSERSEPIQQLIEDYTRHLHECAQALHELTHV